MNPGRLYKDEPGDVEVHNVIPDNLRSALELDDEDEVKDVEVHNVIPDNVRSALEPIDLEELTTQFADERIAFAMDRYKENDDLGLFAVLFLTPKDLIADFFPTMLRAIYRYHSSNPNEDTQTYYCTMLQQGASYLSSSESISLLKTLPSDSTEIDPFDFLELILTEIDFEQRKISPFTINELDDLAKKFIERAEQDPYFSESEERKEKLDDYSLKLFIATI